MKFLIISPSFYPATFYGGPIYSTYEFAKALKKSGIDVRVITTNANGKEKLEIKTGVFHKLENELPVNYYKSLDPRGTSLSMLFNLWKDIKNSDLVYLISIFSPPTPLTIFLCRLYKKPLIISPRGQLGKWCLEQGNRFKKLWLRLFISSRQSTINRAKTDHPVAAKLKTKPEHSSNFRVYWHLTSSAEQQDVLSVYPSAKTFVIPNGVSSELFSLNDKAKDRTYYNKYTGFDCSNKKIVISMGRLQKVKGFDILIEAIGMIQRLVPNLPAGKAGLFRDLMLFIAGEDFGERRNLEKIIDKFKLNDRVFLVGNLKGTDKIEFLHNADVFALPSHHENFGMVYAESLAAGTPVVASTKTPWHDVEKYNCGKWVENTPAKFAEAIIEILNLDAVLMSKNGNKYVEENFSNDKIALEFEKQIKKIVLENN